jgi:hypothetical protein
MLMFSCWGERIKASEKMGTGAHTSSVVETSNKSGSRLFRRLRRLRRLEDDVFFCFSPRRTTRAVRCAESHGRKSPLVDDGTAGCGDFAICRAQA